MNPSNPNGPVVAIVVAAGSGSRLGAEVPKALVPVAGVPLLTRAVAQLAAGGVDDDDDDSHTHARTQWHTTTTTTTTT